MFNFKCLIMSKLSIVVFIVMMLTMSIMAQEHRLSNKETDETITTAKEVQADLNLSAQLSIVLKGDGSWGVDNSSYVVVKSADSTQYVLFSDGKWSKLETVTDIDGNVYQALKLGNYYWTIQNLKTTKFNDGVPITYGPKDNKVWTSQQGAYTTVENKPENQAKTGLLYNWHAANKSKLCPKGWRVPTDKEWENLIQYSGGMKEAAKYLKSKQGWNAIEGMPSFKTSGDDKYMFNAMPTGFRQMHAGQHAFWQIGNEATFWSKTSKTDKQAISVTFRSNNSIDKGVTFKEFGRSIRCIKD